MKTTTMRTQFTNLRDDRANLMQKLDIHEKAGLVRYAIQNGIVDLHE